MDLCGDAVWAAVAGWFCRICRSVVAMAVGIQPGAGGWWGSQFLGIDMHADVVCAAEAMPLCEPRKFGGLGGVDSSWELVSALQQSLYPQLVRSAHDFAVHVKVLSNNL
jgi:hypothetical protein